MKLKNNKIAGLFLSAATMLTLAACSNSSDIEWTPGNGSNLPDVFFQLQSSPADITVGIGQTSTNILLYRTVPGETQTIELTWSGDTQLFGLPTSVAFGADETVAPVTITFDVEQMEPNEGYNLNVQMVGYETTNYTQSDYSVTITYRPMSEWEPFGYNEALGRTGEGRYYFALFQNSAGETSNTYCRVMTRYSITNPDEIEYSFQWLIDDYDPSQGWEQFYLLTSSDGGKTIDIPVQECPISVQGYGQFYYADQSVFGRENTSKFDPTTGTFYLSTAYFLEDGSGWAVDDWCTLVGYVPADYSLEITDHGTLEIDGTNYQLVNISWGPDAEIVEYTVVSTDAVSEDGEVSMTLVKAIAAEMENGQIQTQIADVQGNYPMAFDYSGSYTVVGASYAQDDDGNYEQKEVAYLSFDYTSSGYVDNETWTKVGEGVYTYLPFWVDLAGAEPEVLELYKSEDVADHYKVTYWLFGEDLRFVLNPDNSLVVDDDQPVGISLNSNEVYVNDTQWFNFAGTQWEEYVGTSHLDGNTYYFSVLYSTLSYSFWTSTSGNPSLGVETFVMDESTTAAINATRTSKHVVPMKLEQPVAKAVKKTAEAKAVNFTVKKPVAGGKTVSVAAQPHFRLPVR